VKLRSNIKDARRPNEVGREGTVPRLAMRAEFQPATFDEDERSVEVIFTAGATVRRFGFFGEDFFGEFDESLDFAPGAHRDERLLSNRVAVLDAHRRGSISDQLGVLVDARLDPVTRTGVGTIRFSKREEIDGLVADVRAGIVSNVSIGFQVHQFRDITEPGDDVRHFLAIDWEIHEVSFVPVGADGAAHIRTETELATREDPKNVCILWTEAVNMEPDETIEGTPAQRSAAPAPATPEPASPPAPAPTPDPALRAPTPDIDAIRAEGRAEERARLAGIGDAARNLGLEPSDVFVDGLVRNGTALDSARAALIEHVGHRDESRAINSTASFQVGDSDRDKQTRSITDAMHFRMAPDREHKRDNLQGNEYVHMTLLEIGRSVLTAHGIDTRGLSKSELAGAILSSRSMSVSGGLMTRSASHSTDDFPSILANLMNKELRASYEETPDTWSQWVRRGTLSDFKPGQRPALGASPALLEKLEGAEYKWGTAGEENEPIQLVEYGRVISMSRQMLINDDLDAFSRFPGAFGSRARDLLSDLIYAVLTDNGVMADANALFSAAHNNTSTGVLAVAGLSALRLTMRTQTGIAPGDGEAAQAINVPLKHLRVPAALETTAEQLTAGLTPNTPGDVNPFIGSFETVAAEPRLDPTSAVQYYGMGPKSLAGVELAFLQGEDGPVTETRTSFSTDSMDLKVRQTAGVSAIEFRGISRSSGA